MSNRHASQVLSRFTALHHPRPLLANLLAPNADWVGNVAKTNALTENTPERFEATRAEEIPANYAGTKKRSRTISKEFRSKDHDKPSTTNGCRIAAS